MKFIELFLETANAEWSPLDATLSFIDNMDNDVTDNSKSEELLPVPVFSNGDLNNEKMRIEKSMAKKIDLLDEKFDKEVERLTNMINWTNLSLKYGTVTKQVNFTNHI